MTGLDLILCIIGMALGTALPRVLPLTWLADREMPDLVQRWLSFVPAAILAALVAPELLLKNEKLFLAWDNLFLLAAVPTIFLAWKSKSLFITVAGGMALVAAGRWWMGGVV